MWAEVSSSAPHFLQSGLSLSPSQWRCLYRVLCLVRNSVTTLDMNRSIEQWEKNISPTVSNKALLSRSYISVILTADDSYVAHAHTHTHTHTHTHVCSLYRTLLIGTVKCTQFSCYTPTSDPSPTPCTCPQTASYLQLMSYQDTGHCPGQAVSRTRPDTERRPHSPSC
jgi:hypothetical protein